MLGFAAADRMWMRGDLHTSKLPADHSRIAAVKWQMWIKLNSAKYAKRAGTHFVMDCYIRNIGYVKQPL